MKSADSPIDFAYEQFLQHLLLSNVEGLLILDAGCGTGWISLYLRSIGLTPIACDISSEIVRNTKSRFKSLRVDIPLIQCSMERLPFRESTFDSVLAISTLEHCHTLKHVLTQFHYSLKKAGKFIIVTPNGMTFGMVYDRFLYKFLPDRIIENSLERVVKRTGPVSAWLLGTESEPGHDHAQELTAKSLNIALKDSGFSDIVHVNSKVFEPLMRSFTTLLGHRPLASFERADSRIALKLPVQFGTEWFLTCKKVD